jgi:hypothetical protein
MSTKRKKSKTFNNETLQLINRYIISLRHLINMKEVAHRTWTSMRHATMRLMTMQLKDHAMDVHSGTHGIMIIPVVCNTSTYNTRCYFLSSLISLIHHFHGSFDHSHHFILLIIKCYCIIPTFFITVQ